MSIRKMSSSANQPGLGRDQPLVELAPHVHEREAADASRYFTVPAVSKSTPSCATSSGIAPAAW